MTSPLVSVAVITYNHAPFIRECLDGVLMQKTDFSFEVVIGEDCSTDNTREIIQEYVEKYPGLIKPVFHDKNVGGARNAYEYCYPRLTGKYIAICEGDDYWTDPLKLQKQIDLLEKNEQIALCYHRINNVDVNGKVLKEKVPEDNIYLYTWQDIFHLKIPTLSVVYRNCITIDPKEMMRVKSGDYYLFGLLSSCGGAAEMGFVGANYRQHAGGVYTSLSTINQYKQSIRTLKLMIGSPSFNKAQKKEIKKEIGIRKRRYIRQFMHKKDVMNTLKILFE